MKILGEGSIQTANVLNTSKSIKRHIILLYNDGHCNSGINDVAAGHNYYSN